MTRGAGRKKALSVNQRRMYVDWRHGQLHLRSAFPPSGGFDELTPLICLHGEAGSSRVFGRLLGELGADRSVYAPDLPGSGESDPAPRRAGAPECAAAVGDFLDQMRLRTVDVLGHQWGGWVAAELALARPEQVRRVVFVSAPAAIAARELPGCLAGLTQPVLALRLKDGQWDLTPAVRTALPEAKLVELPGQAADALESASEELTRHVRAFLR